MAVQQVREGGAHRVENAYPRVVTREGNVKAKRLMYEVFEPYDVEWRGFPVIPASGLRLKPEFEGYDAQKKYDIEIRHVDKHSACICDKVLRGIARPSDCKLFGKVCTPRTPRRPPAWSATKEPARSGISTNRGGREPAPSAGLLYLTQQHNMQSR